MVSITHGARTHPQVVQLQAQPPRSGHMCCHVAESRLLHQQGQGIEGGNLYLRITVAPHAFFKIEGSDVFCQVPVTPSEAVLGGLVEVPTLDGRVKMNVPSGVRSGQRLRLANKGYPDAEGKRGDQLVEIQIVVPKDPSPQVKELYEQLRQLDNFNPRQNLGN